MIKGKKNNIIIAVFIFFCQPLFGQTGISFYSNTELDNLLKIAQREDKNIFVDTYAKWCTPCKKLNQTFMDSEVGEYFNANFINVKYDVESVVGKKVDLKYQVVFLPTILILDKYGNVRIKVDGQVLQPGELIKIAKAVTQPYEKPAVVSNPPPSNTRNDVSNSPQSAKVTTKAKPNSEISNVDSKPITKEEIIKKDNGEKILFVLDDNAEIPPEVLKLEAYYRLKLMNGTHRETAEQYLATQEDWSTEENLKFLHDFLYDTNTKQFEYFINNRTLFEDTIGEEKVANSIEILVYNKLYYGNPRPTLEQAVDLFGHIDPHNKVNNAQRYYLNRLAELENLDKYIEFASLYTSKYNTQDHAEMYRLSRTISTENKDEEAIKKCIKLIEKANKLSKDNFEYKAFETELYLLLGDQDKVRKLAKEALELAKDQNLDPTFSENLIKKISQ